MEQIRAVASNMGERAKAVKLPKIGKQDALAAVTTGVANIPDGMASAVLAGVNPVYGIYTLIIGTPLAALSSSTRLMMFNTTSAMTLVAVDGLGLRTGQSRVSALITIAFVAGVFQLVLGILGLGMMTKFVSNAVMVGFLTGIASLIIMGQLWDLTGYEGEGGGGRLERTAQLLANLRDVDLVTSIFGVGSLTAMFLLTRTKLANYNLLIVLASATLLAWITNPDSLVLVSSLGDIPRSLPSFELPSFALIPRMLLAGIAVGAVGLLQAAGVAQAYPNTDGTDNSDSRDFIGQGIANIANSFFQGMAGGGSLSGTAMNVSAGAKTQYANVIQAVVVLITVLVFGGVLSQIPMAGLAALLVFSAISSIRLPAIAMVGRTSRTSLIGMTVTFCATLVMPLQQAVMVGIALASILFLYRASSDIRLMRMRIVGEKLVVSEAPTELPSNEVTVLDVDGNLFYAGARTLGKLLPNTKTTEHAGVVLRIRGQAEIGSTFFKVVGKYADELRSRGGVLLLAGVDPIAKNRMDRAGLLGQIGEDRVFIAGNVIGESTSDALRAGEAWLGRIEQPSPAQTGEVAQSLEVEVVRDVASTVDPEPAGASEKSAAIRTNIRSEVFGFLNEAVTSLTKASSRASILTGIAGLTIGLLAVIFTDKMLHLLMPLIGLVFLLAAGFWIYTTIQNRADDESSDATYSLLTAGVALATGSALIVQPFTDYIMLTTAEVLMSIGLILIGAIGLIPAYRGKSSIEDRISSLTVNLAGIVFALVILLTMKSAYSAINVIGWISVAAGACLIVYGFMLSRFSKQSSNDEQLPTGDGLSGG